MEFNVAAGIFHPFAMIELEILLTITRFFCQNADVRLLKPSRLSCVFQWGEPFCIV